MNQNTNADLGDMNWMNDADFSNLPDLDLSQVNLSGTGMKSKNVSAPDMYGSGALNP